MGNNKSHHQQHGGSGARGGSNQRSGAQRPSTGNDMERKIENESARSERSEGSSGSMATSALESAKERVGEGVEQGKQAFEQGKDALLGMKETVTEKVETQLDSAKTAMRDAASDTQEILERAGRTVGTALKENPIPFAMTGIGVAGVTWLVMDMISQAREGSSGKSATLTTSGDGKATRAGNRGSSTRRAKNVANAATNAASSTGAAIARTSRDLLERGRELEGNVERLARENPMATGAALFAAGAAVGLALPRTMREDSWLGQSRDRIVSKVSEAARGALDKVESVAHAVTGEERSGSPSSMSH